MGARKRYLDVELEHQPRVPDLNDVDELHLDLGRVTILSSLQIKYWMTWIPNVLAAFPDVQLVLHRIPAIMMGTIFSIKQFLPRSSKVESMWVDFYCSKCESTTSILFEATRQFGSTVPHATTQLALSETKCRSCGEAAEPEGRADRYFFVFDTYG